MSESPPGVGVKAENSNSNSNSNSSSASPAHTPATVPASALAAATSPNVAISAGVKRSYPDDSTGPPEPIHEAKAPRRKPVPSSRSERAMIRIISQHGRRVEDVVTEAEKWTGRAFHPNTIKNIVNHKNHLEDEADDYRFVGDEFAKAYPESERLYVTKARTYRRASAASAVPTIDDRYDIESEDEDDTEPPNKRVRRISLKPPHDTHENGNSSHGGGHGHGSGSHDFSAMQHDFPMFLHHPQSSSASTASASNQDLHMPHHRASHPNITQPYQPTSSAVGGINPHFRIIRRSTQEDVSLPRDRERERERDVAHSPGGTTYLSDGTTTTAMRRRSVNLPPPPPKSMVVNRDRGPSPAPSRGKSGSPPPMTMGNHMSMRRSSHRDSRHSLSRSHSHSRSRSPRSTSPEMEMPMDLDPAVTNWLRGLPMDLSGLHPLLARWNLGSRREVESFAGWEESVLHQMLDESLRARITPAQRYVLVRALSRLNVGEL